MKRPTRPELNKLARYTRSPHYRQATAMKNHHYYLMDSDGWVYPVPYERHDQWVRDLLYRFCKKSRELCRWYDRLETEERVLLYFYMKGWLRLGIINWYLDVWPSGNWNKRQRVALASWCMGGPSRTITPNDYSEFVGMGHKRSE